VGDATKAKTVLGWEAHTRTPELARLMVDADLAALTTVVDVRTSLSSSLDFAAGQKKAH